MRGVRTGRLGNWLVGVMLVVVVGVLGVGGVEGAAQVRCDVIIDTGETSVVLTAEDVCGAVEPWNRQGVRVFIYLTDFAPATEDEWFEQLDIVEIRAGIAGFENGEIGFERDVLALEASTADIDFATNLTYGESLWGTPIDVDEQLVAQMKSALRSGLRTGRAAVGVNEALRLGWAETFGATADGGEVSILVPTVVVTPVVDEVGTGGTDWANILSLMVMGLVMGSGVVAVGLWWMRPRYEAWLEEREREEMLLAQRERLARTVGGLLEGLWVLLKGDEPADMVLYRLVMACGGGQSPERLADLVLIWQQSQRALTQGFVGHKALQKQLEVEDDNDLEGQVRAWELLYLVLIGSDAPELQSEKEKPLRDLLDLRGWVAPFAEETASLQIELGEAEKGWEGVDLLVPLQVVELDGMEDEGVLLAVEATQSAVVELAEAKALAPSLLAGAAEQGEVLKTTVTKKIFELEPEVLLAPWRAHVAAGEKELAAGRFLYAIDRAEAAEEWVAAAEQAMAVWGGYEEQLGRVMGQAKSGYRSPDFMALIGELKAGVGRVKGAWQVAALTDVVTELDILAATGERLVANMDWWVGLHGENSERLARLASETQMVIKLAQGEALGAWQKLNQYPAENWNDITQGVQGPLAVLREVAGGDLVAIKRLNGMEAQAFVEAEGRLDEAETAVADTLLALNEIIHRWQEVSTAEKTIEGGIAEAERVWREAVALRDAEDAKISPEVDEILVGVETKLGMARALAGERRFVEAVQKQVAARSEAKGALAAAEAEIAEIDALESELAVKEQEINQLVEALLAQAKGQKGVVRTNEGSALLAAAEESWAAARQGRTLISGVEDKAWQAALVKVIGLWEGVEEAVMAAKKQLEADEVSYEALYDEVATLRVKVEGIIDSAKHMANTSTEEGLVAAVQRGLPMMLVAGVNRHQLVQMKKELEQALREAEQARREIRYARQKAEQAARQGWQMTNSHSSSGGWSSNRSYSSSRRSSIFSSSSRSSSSRSSSSSSSRGGRRRSSSSSSRGGRRRR
ncbi:MAG TPA: hypothetical protein VLL52_10280 [Anaerolineae bacterium]|nr:hypothetical protein [Anaerolineae bacterium]